MAKPGSITPHRKFLAQVYVLKKEEGGRHKAFFSGYRPQFYVRTMDVTGDITLPQGVEVSIPSTYIVIPKKRIAHRAEGETKTVLNAMRHALCALRH